MHQDPSQNIAHAQLPNELTIIDSHRKAVRKALKNAGVPQKLLDAISTRALRSGRRQTGEFKSNRNARWTLKPGDPQYGTEVDCKIIELRLVAMSLQFDNAPTIDPGTQAILEQYYLGEPIVAGTYQDSLLLEKMDFQKFIDASENPKHGSSNFHLGHENPTLTPKHAPSNISWRSHRSNLIQGDMTLRQARIYFVKLIARYFELGELAIE